MPRRRRSPLSLPLLVLALAVLAGWAAACSGGDKHGVGPCCGATGSVEQPATGPSFAATAAAADLYAQPFVLVTNDCIALATLDLTSLLDMPKVGSAVKIDASLLTYTVKINASAEGHQVAIVVFDTLGGTKNVRGIGLVPGPIEPSEIPIQVAPIQLLPEGTPPTSATAFGESTIEAAALCELSKRGLAGSLVAADVRAVLTSSIAGSYAPSATNASIVLNRLLDYESALGDLTSVGTAAQQSAFASYRDEVESDVDACLAGVNVAGCDPTPDGIDLFRYTRYAGVDASFDPWGDAAAPLGDEWPHHAQCFVQRLNDRLGDPVPLGAPVDTFALKMRQSMIRQTNLFRAALAEVSIVRALQAPIGPASTTVDLNFSVTTAGIPSINQAISQLSTSLASTDPSNTDLVVSIWVAFGDTVSKNLDRQLFDPNGQSMPINGATSNGFTFANDVQATLSSSSSYVETYAAVIDDSSGTSSPMWARLRALVAAQAPLNSFSVTDQARLTDVIFFSSVNGAVVPQGPPAPDTIP